MKHGQKVGQILEKGYLVAKKNGGELISIRDDYYNDLESKNFALMFVHKVDKKVGGPDEIR